MNSFMISKYNLIKPIRVRMKVGRHVECIEKCKSYTVLMGKPDGKGQIWRPRHRWENNIQLYFKEIGWNGMKWIHLTQDSNKWWGMFWESNLLCTFIALSIFSLLYEFYIFISFLPFPLCISHPFYFMRYYHSSPSSTPFFEWVLFT